MEAKDIVDKILRENQLKIDGELLIKIAEEAMKVGAIQFADWIKIPERSPSFMIGETYANNGNMNDRTMIGYWGTSRIGDGVRYTSEELYDKYLREENE